MRLCAGAPRGNYGSADRDQPDVRGRPRGQAGRMSALVFDGTVRRRLRVPLSIRACLFDLDGVLTQTASLHEAAWKSTFDDFLRAYSTARGEAFVPFMPEDYASYVDGRPRGEGIQAFLESRGIEASTSASNGN